MSPSVPSAPDIDGLDFVEHLGTGGYSDVYLYERRTPRMKIAVKVLKEGRLAETQLVQFAAEAETMAELADHPYIVQVFSTGATGDGRPYLVMKYYPPPNLGVRAARERFTVADVLRTGVKIASAVETAHRAGILHRDIKPANILVSQYGEPGLTDFGIAGRAAEAGQEDDLGVSIPWSPPEVLSGESNGSVQADVYSLAATLWHLLVGRSPFEVAGGDNAPRALVSRILRTPPPATGRADVPASLERLLQQAMSKNATTRPRSALELARSLQGVEQELRYARTEIVTNLDIDTGDRGSARPQRDSAGQDATRLRAPARVSPQARSTVQRKPSSAEGPPPAAPTALRPQRPTAPAERQRTAMPDEPSATVLRPSRPTASAPDVAEPPRPVRRGVKTRWVVVAASAALIAAVVIGVVLSSKGNGNNRQRGDSGTTMAPSDQLGALDPPEQPVVVATRDAAAKKVRFTWSYGNPETGDYALWSSRSGAPSHRLTADHLDLSMSPSVKSCIVVRIVRASGQTSLPSSRVCG